ncbi:MAG: aldo/keto reductase, partial [Acidiferrobacter sp.]
MGLLGAGPAGPIPGVATREATLAYSRSHGSAFDPGHYSDFQGRIKLSAIGLGTFPGLADDD